MFNVEFAIDSWIYLALGVAMIAALWIWSFKSLSGLGQFRRILALVLRSLVVLALILALANLQLRRKNDRLTVMYLLDQSASIPQVQREAMVDYVVEEVRRHRDDSYRDRASVIVFGRQANIEVAPIDDNLPIVDRLEGTTNMRIDATNMAAALRMAMATFPEDSARRIVIVSDGNENLGDAASLANELARDGVGIDVVPVRLEGGADVAVERVAVPSEIRKGQPFEASVVLNNLKSPTGSPDDNIRGKIKLSRRRASHEEILATPDIELKPGKNIYRFEHLIDEPDFYEYRVEFVADDSAADVIVENNRATGFTHVQGQGHVLLIEDWEHRDGDGEGEFQYLVERLRAMDIQVTVQFSDELFTTLGDLQRYDTVILANVPRASGSDADNITNFSEAQIAMLLKNTHEMGCGLVMLGGDEAYGAGGWSNSELEKAMPVDFQIHNAKVQMVGALAMVMHASELAQGNHWQKVVAREALKTLGPQDYCGVIHWDGNTGKEAWLWGHPQGIQKVSGNRDRMIGILDRMAPGDMPEFDPSLKMAVAGFNALPEKTLRHMIVISDGDPSPPRMSTVADFKRANVKISTVAIGTHGPAGSTILQNLAQATGGKYYRVRDPNALPKIYQKEARRVARPLIVERDVAPVVTA
ncbi:MAG: VWA domain-containing protein, partial [Planctomycetales bacterium]|nr:VWA domain-containing protein [Planctomycetales bacterium]